MIKKRLRIFAGPNGSGKSTLIKLVADLKIHLGQYVNADDLKFNINRDHLFDFNTFNLIFDLLDFKETFVMSLLFIKAEGESLIDSISEKSNCLIVPDNVQVNDYFTSFLSDYLRNKLLYNSDKFTFETVMSHPSKLDFILKAREQGFLIYLYFVSLSSPEMNKGRVEARVKLGGHNVPDDKIVERYARTMNLLLDAIRLADKTFLFDNSYSEPKLFATVEDNEISIRDNVEYIPGWFQKYVIDKL